MSSKQSLGEDLGGLSGLELISYSYGKKMEGSSISSLSSKMFSQQSLSEEDLGRLSALQLIEYFYGKNKESCDDDDAAFLKSTRDLRSGNIGNALQELCLIVDDPLSTSLSKRLDITWERMLKVEDSYNKKEWTQVLKHTKAAIKLGVDMCTRLYLYRTQAFLASNLTEEAVAELSSAVLSLFKNQGGYFKAPEKNEEEAALNQANFDQAIMSITKDQCVKLLQVEEGELLELEEELADRVMGLKAAVSLLENVYDPAIKNRAARVHLLKEKKESFCTLNLAKKKQEEGNKEGSDVDECE
ncbi:hypothetical protein HA466_0050370 [Hirschfeldia incana]|nr:hypothetical protein HA466_0050370 [Hirschfeldia incana]